MRIAAAIVSALALCASTAANADTSGKRIALSNNYAGNSWRQAMLKSWAKVGDQAVADKIVAAADAFTTADKEAPTQAAQIQNLILQGYNAIVLDAASPDALNGAVKQACDAGVVVVAFDGLVTEPCAYKVTVDLAGTLAPRRFARSPSACRTAAISFISAVSPARASTTTSPRASRRNGQASQSQDRRRGERQLGPDDRAEGGCRPFFPRCPRSRASSTRAATPMARRRRSRRRGESCRSSCSATARTNSPGGRTRIKASGYNSWSGSEAPGMVTFAFWVAQQVLDGKPVPKEVPMGILTIEQKDVDKYSRHDPRGRRRQCRIHPG